MKHLMFLLLILSFDVSVAQDIKILKKEFSQSSSNQHRAEIASELSWLLKDQNPDSSLFYAEHALTYSRLAKDHKIEAFSLSDIGNYYKRLENYKKAHGYYIKSLHLRKSVGNIEDISSAYNQLGLLYRQWEKYDSAAYYFSEGLNLLPRNQYIKMRMKLLDGLGMTLFHMGDYKMAMYKVDASRRLSEELKDSLSIAESWQNTGTINQYIGNASLALSNYKKAGIYYRALGNLNGEIEMEINRAAIYFIQGKYNQAEGLLLSAKSKSETLNFLGERSTIYLNLAKLYDITSPSKALYYYEMAYEYASQKGKDATRIDAAIGLVNHLIQLNNVEAAERIIKELELLIISGDRKEYFAEYYDLLSEIHKIKRDFESAFTYSQKASINRNQIYIEGEKSQDMMTSLEIADRERKLLKEQIKRQVTEARLRNIQIWSMAIVIAVLLLTIFLIKKNQRMKREEKIRELRHETEINDLVYESELKFLESALELEEDIRKNIGRDLHDNLGSKLAVAQMTADSLIGKLTKASEQYRILTEMSSLLDESCSDLRSISHDLVGEELRNESLNLAVENICKIFSDNFHIEFIPVGKSYPLSLNVKKNILSTIRLLIDNVIRHSQATKVSLQVFYHDDVLNIELEDNGIGFEKDYVNLNGIGLRNAHERMSNIGGNIEVNSRKNNGTIVSISVPSKYEK